MAPASSQILLCPICRAENRRDASSCFLCGQSLAGAEAVAADKPLPAVSRGIPRPRFRLGTIMLVIALIAVSLSVWDAGSPALFFGFAVPAVIALVHTVAVSDGRGSAVGHARVFLGTFVVVVGAVVGVSVAGFAAFCATCLAITSTGQGEFGGSRLGPGLIVGAAAGGAVMIGITVLLVRRATRRGEVAASPEEGSSA